jgi:peptidyl-prolyl cis-trans isomerase C
MKAGAWLMAWGLAGAAWASEPSGAEAARLAALAQQAGLDEAKAQSVDAREQLEAELAMRDILGAKAKALGLDKDPKVAAAMELAALSALGQAYLERSRPAPDPQAIEEDWRSAYPPKPMARVKVAIFKDAARAREALAKLRSGTPMATVASSADDQLLAKQGGDLGWIALDALPSELSKALDAPGRWPSEPIRTPYGFAVYELDGRETAPEKTLEQAAPELVNRRLDLARKVELAKLRIEAQGRLSKPR